MKDLGPAFVVWQYEPNPADGWRAVRFGLWLLALSMLAFVLAVPW